MAIKPTAYFSWIADTVSSASAASAATTNAVYFWNEDNLEPRAHGAWLDWVLAAVRNRAWE